MVDGVTTNPSLIAKEKRGFDSVVREILEIVEGPVSLEVVSLEAKGMYAEGKKLARLGDQVVGKGIELDCGPATEIKERKGFLHGPDYLCDWFGIKIDRFCMAAVPATTGIRNNTKIHNGKDKHCNYRADCTQTGHNKFADICDGKPH